MHVWHRYNRKSHVCTFLIYGEGFERMKKVFIFGIGGFAGSYLAQEFIDNGYVVAGSDKVKSESLNKLVDFVEADLLNAENIEKIVSEKKPDMIINLAAISSVGASWGIPQITMSVNVIGALNIMEAARKIDNRPKVMFIGSSEEYAVSDKPMNEQTILNANNPYGISKMAQEKFAEVYRERYGMQIYCVGTYSPPIGFEKDRKELLKIAGMVKKASPDIFAVSLGSPKGEKFIYRHLKEYGVSLGISIGATIDFEAGNVKRAPKWMADHGLEWLFRITQDPKRLIKRYWNDAVNIVPIIRKYKNKG